MSPEHGAGAVDVREPSELSRLLTWVRTTADFVDACRQQVAVSTFVSLNPGAYEQFVEPVKSVPLASWDFYLAKGDETSSFEAFYEFTFNAALNGGYFQLGAGGAIEQWTLDGSGSRALAEWISHLHEAGLFPGVNLRTPEAVRDSLGPLLAELPLSDERLAICEEFASGPRRALLAGIMLSAERPSPNAGVDFVFSLESVDALVALYPKAFGADPFRKKAILACLEMTGYLTHRGCNVWYDLPIPADYQIPRVLAWGGAIRLSSDGERLLRSGKLLDVRSALVEDMRAAAVVAAHDISLLAGCGANYVDNALFTQYRGRSDFIEQALPPMRCASLWF